MNSLYDDLIRLKQDLLFVREEFGDPRLKRLVFLFPTPESLYTVIKPKSIVSKVPEKMIGLPIGDGNILITSEDYYVKNVSRIYDYQMFKYKCWLDPVFNDSGVLISGIACRCHMIDDKKGLSYHLILKKEYEQNIL